MVRINSRIAIPESEIELTYARSGGPGGQNVNKVASKAVLRFDLARTPSLPAPARRRALERLAPRLTTSGELVMSCDTHRDQARNREEVIERFRQLIAGAVAVPKRRVPTKPSAGARERRLEEKRARGRLKRERSTTE